MSFDLESQYVIYMLTYLLDGNGETRTMASRYGGEYKPEKGEHVYSVNVRPEDISATVYAYQFYRAIPLRGGRGSRRFIHSGHNTARDHSQLFSREGKPLGHNPLAQVVQKEKQLAHQRLEKILADKKKSPQG